MEKLDCKALMIGDWVYSSFYYNSTKPCRITGIRTFDIKDVYAFVYIDKVEDIKDINSLTPIPLTSEILEKNGFEYKEKELGLYGVITAPHYLRDDIPFEVFCDGEPFAIWFKEPVNIKFVHQLQHAMLLCGIRKEIVI